MPRFTFSREGEPRTLDPYYDALQDATLVETVGRVVPGLVQTVDYARAILEQSGDPPRRAEKRALRRVTQSSVLGSAAVLGRIVIPVAALRNVNSIGGDRDTLRGQLDYLVYLTERKLDGSTGPNVGILPAEVPERVGTLRIVGQSATCIDTEVETPTGTKRDRLLVGMDGFDVVSVSTQDPSGIEVVQHRQQLLATVMARAIFGEDARAAILEQYNAL